MKGRGALRTLAASEAARCGGYRWAEFGVRGGKSARALLGLLPPGRGQLHLFDSWNGLPEPWDRGGGEVIPVGHFAGKVPTFKDRRVQLHVGLFEETIPKWRDRQPYSALDLAHIDCDLYTSTVHVLEGCRTAFLPGAVLIFDDLFGYPNWRHGQWRAWSDWIGPMDHTWIGRTEGGQAAVRLNGAWRREL